MDSQDKGTSWIGNICKKLETIYSGIDSITSEDSFEYAENQLLAAGENVKQFCSEFMQEMIPDFLKETATDLQETKEFDISACELIKNDMDEGHKTGLSDFNSSVDSFPLEAVKEADTYPSFSAKSCDGKEKSLGKNLLKVKVVPSKIARVEASEKDALGMKSSVSGVNQFHDSGFDGRVDLTNAEAVQCKSSCSSAKGERSNDTVEVKVDSSTIPHSASVSAEYDKGKFLKNEDSSSGDAFSEALGNSTERPGDGITEKRKDVHVNTIGMDIIEPFNTLTVDGSYIIVDGYKISSASDMQAEYGTSLAAGSGDNNAGFQQTGLNGPVRSLHTAESKPGDEKVCESDWEII